MRHAERRALRKAAEARGEVRVSWRRVSPLTGGNFAEGGWSGIGPLGVAQTVYVRPLPGDIFGWEYGWNRNGALTALGVERTPNLAKHAAEELFKEGSEA